MSDVKRYWVNKWDLHPLEDREFWRGVIVVLASAYDNQGLLLKAAVYANNLVLADLDAAQARIKVLETALRKMSNIAVDTFIGKDDLAAMVMRDARAALASGQETKREDNVCR